MAYVPFGMACLNYNTMGSQYFGAAAMLSLMGILEGRRSFSFWGGVFWVLCVFSYPTAMITFVLFAAITTVLFYQKKNWFQHFVKPFFLGLDHTQCDFGGRCCCGLESAIFRRPLSSHVL